MATTRPRHGSRKKGSIRSASPRRPANTVGSREANDRLRRRANAWRAIARARDELLFAAAHELRTPLTSVHGFATLLLTHLDSPTPIAPEALREAAVAIEQQSQRLCRLVAELLDTALIESGRMALVPRPTNVGKLLESVASTARGPSRRSSLVIRMPAPLLAEVDPVRLEQVVTNLVDNAIKYSPIGGVVTLSAEMAEGGVEIAVADQGPGVRPEHRPHIFDPFYQAAPQARAGGLGLGLHLSRQIVELHGGRLTAEFPETGGTRMVVRLPPRPPKQRNPPPGQGGHGERFTSRRGSRE